MARCRVVPGSPANFACFRSVGRQAIASGLARQLPLVEAVVALDEFCFRRVVQVADVIAYAAARKQWPGSAKAMAALGLVEPKSESPMETRLRLVLIRAGLPRPIAQYVVVVDGRTIARLDLAYPEWKIGVEYDGDHHRDRPVFAADLRRQNKLVAAGWTILRFTATDIYRNPDTIVAQIRVLIP